MLKQASRFVQVGVTTLSLLGLAAGCSTSALTGNTGSEKSGAASAPAAPTTAPASSVDASNANATAAPGVVSKTESSGDATSIFSQNSFAALSPTDQATPGCALPQTAAQLATLATAQASGTSWGSGSGSGWGSGSGSAWGSGSGYGGQGGYGSAASGCAAGWGSGAAAPGAVHGMPHPGSSAGYGSTASASGCASGSGSGSVTFSVSTCQWAQNAKPGLMIVITTTTGATFAQPYGTGTDTTTEATCTSAAEALATALGVTAKCESIPTTN